MSLLSKCERKKRISDKKRDRMKASRESYREKMSELFFLQSGGSIVDLAAFRKKPNAQFVNFLKSNNCPKDILDEVRKAVGGTAASLGSSQASARTSSSSQSSSSRLAHSSSTSGSSEQPPGSRSSSSHASSSSQHRSTPPAFVHLPKSLTSASSSSSPSSYSPRTPANPMLTSNLLRHLEPVLSPHLHNRTQHLHSAAFPSYSPMRQEGWVLKRIQELTKEGRWSPKRIPKVCERPRPRTHTDCLLQEMQWLAVDFYQERQWKKAAARMLAYSAKEFVERWELKKTRTNSDRERKRKKMAAFAASGVSDFWSESVRRRGTKRPFPEQADDVADWEWSSRTPRSSESIVPNGDLSDLSDMDDESTISEQEKFEKHQSGENLAVQEIKGLVMDSTLPLDSLVNEDYFSKRTDYASSSETSSEEDDVEDENEEGASSNGDSIDFDDLDSEGIEELLNEDRSSSNFTERTVRVKLKPGQKKLYDDFLAEPSSQKRMENGDVNDLPGLLLTLRKICNDPRLVKEDYSDESAAVCFPRVTDVEFHPLFASALEYNPYSMIDLNSLNFVYVTHEVRMTAIVSDRIRKFCAPRKLIEELPKKKSQTSSNPPVVPPGRLPSDEVMEKAISYVGPNSRTMTRSLSFNPQAMRSASVKEELTTSSANTSASSDENKGKKDQAFDEDSLGVIAKFNERRCKGMPLFGQDLILKTLSIMKSVKPPRTKHRGIGYVHCLNATEKGSEGNKEQYGEFKLKTSALGRIVSFTESQAQTERSNLTLRCAQGKVKLRSQGNSRAVDKAQLRTMHGLTDLSKSFAMPIVRPEANNSRPRRDISEQSKLVLSAKLEALHAFLSEIRLERERAVVFCEMDEVLYFLRQHFHSIGFPFLFLDPLASRSERQKVLSRFVKRPDLVCLLTSTATKASGISNLVANIGHVFFYDSSWTASKESGRWCRILCKNSRKNITIHRVVSEGTLEDNISRVSFQDKVATEMKRENGIVWKIKKQTLEDLFGVTFGDNGISREEVEKVHSVHILKYTSTSNYVIHIFVHSLHLRAMPRTIAKTQSHTSRRCGQARRNRCLFWTWLRRIHLMERRT